MRVATYSQPGAPTRGSVVALCVLVITIMLGTGIVPAVAAFVGGPLERLLTPLWLVLYIGAFLGLMFTHGINWVSWLVRYRILLVFLMIGTVLSVSWAMDARVSAERTVHLVGSTLLAVYIGFTIPLLTTLRTFAVLLALAMVASVLVVLGLPELGMEEYEGQLVWRGVFNSKNDLGFWAAAGVLLYVTLSDSTQTTSRKVLCFLMAGVCLAMLGVSQSATSLLAMLVAGALSSYLFLASRFQLGFFRMVFLAVLFGGVIAMAVANIDTAELVGRTDDLTGRGEVWQQTWKLILERPLTGFGYGVLWFPTDATIWIQQSLTDFTWIVFHAHNGFLQVASEVGLPLALIAVLMVAQQLIEIFYCQYERQQVGVLFVLGFVIAFLISNFSEARFLISRELFWIFFVALPISMLRQINLVSAPETGEQSDEYDDQDRQATWGAGTRGFGRESVVARPWLDALPDEQRQVHGAGRDELLEHQTDVDEPSSHSGGSAEPHPDAIHLDYDLTQDFPLMEEADIDLGDVEPAANAAVDPQKLAEDLDESQLMSDTLDLTETDDIEDIDLDIRAEREPLEHGAISYDDSLDVDRYDKNIDLTGDWVDVPLDDER